MGKPEEQPRKVVGFRIVGEQPLPSPPPRARLPALPHPQPRQADGDSEEMAKAIAEGIYRHSSHGTSELAHGRRSTDTIEERHAAPLTGDAGLVIDMSDALLSPLEEQSINTESDWRNEAWRAKQGADAESKLPNSFGPVYEHAGSSKQPSTGRKASSDGLRWSMLSGTTSPSSRRWTAISGAKETVSQGWQKARTILMAQKATRRSFFSRQIGSIVLHEAPSWMQSKQARDCVTWSCGLLVLLPVLLAFLTFAASYGLALAFVSWPWLRDGSMPDGCHKSPSWMSSLLESRVQDSISHVRFPQEVLGGHLHPQAEVLGWKVQIRNVTLRRLHIDQFEMAACYNDDRLAFPLLMPARSTVMEMHNVTFESSAHFDVYGFLGVYIGSGDAIVTGEGAVRIETDPMNLRHFVTSCSTHFDDDKIALHVTGLGQSLIPSSSLPVFLNFDSLMCEGRSLDSLYSFEGPRVFRGVPTEVNAVVLKEVPRLHMLLRLAFLVLAAITLGVLSCGFGLRWWIQRFNKRLWGQRTVDFYLRRWLGQRQYNWLQTVSFYTALLALFCTFFIFIFLSVCYFLTDEQVAYAPAPGQLRHSGGGFRDSLPCHGAGCDMEELPEDVDPMLEAALLNSIPGF